MITWLDQHFEITGANDADENCFERLNRPMSSQNKI